MQQASNPIDALHGHNGLDALRIAKWFIARDPRLKRRAMRLGGVDEVASEAVFRLIQNSNGLKKYKLSTCVCKSVLWTIGDLSRKKRQHNDISACWYIGRDLRVDAVQESVAEACELAKILNDAVKDICGERKAMILSLRYQGSTLDEVSSMLKVTRERVRQLEASAIRKLQTSARIGEIARSFWVD